MGMGMGIAKVFRPITHLWEFPTKKKSLNLNFNAKKIMYELKNDEKKFNLASLEIVVKNKFRWKFPTKINEVTSGR